MDQILLVDDHEVILEGIRNLLERSGREGEICGMAHNGQEGVELARNLKPDVIVLDISMPVMNGIEAAKSITQNDENAKVVLFTMHDSIGVENEAREAGARGLVVKSQASKSLVRAIEAVLGGKTFFRELPEGESSENAPQSRKPRLGPLYLIACPSHA